METKFKRSDFEDMVFNPFLLKEGQTMEDKYPALKKIIPESSKMEAAKHYHGFNQILKTCAFMYDKGTPLATIQGFSARRTEAMRLAGYGFTDVNGVPEPAESKNNGGRLKDVQMGRDIFFNRISILFLRSHKSHSYSLIKAADAAYYKAIEDLQNGVGKTKDNLQLLDELKDKIDTEMEVLFSGKGDENLRQELNAVLLEEELHISPEDIAERRKRGEYISFK